jgi:hypothetical protein
VIVKDRRVAGTEVLTEEAEPVGERHHLRCIGPDAHVDGLCGVGHDPQSFLRFAIGSGVDEDVVAVADHREPSHTDLLVDRFQGEVGQRG